jgi:hypothetical protein
VLLLHLVSFSICVGLVGCVLGVIGPQTHTRALDVGVATGFFAYGGLSFLTGLGSMALRPPNAESIWLAVSTIAAFLLFFFGSMSAGLWLH